MKAALCKSLDGPESVVIEEIADPVPGEGEVLVRVRAAALNFFDALTLRGKYQFKPALPFSPGSEAAGDIEMVGPGVTGYKPGDRVICYGFTGGAVREKLVARIDTLIPLPDKVGYDVGAGVGVAMHKVDETYFTENYYLQNRIEGDESYSFAWSLMAGVGYQLTDRATLDLGYRYIDLGDAESGRVDNAGFVNPKVDIDDLAAHEIKIGLRFSLGESSCCAQEYAPMK